MADEIQSSIKKKKSNNNAMSPQERQSIVLALEGLFAMEEDGNRQARKLEEIKRRIDEREQCKESSQHTL